MQRSLGEPDEATVILMPRDALMARYTHNEQETVACKPPLGVSSFKANVSSAYLHT
jgi:hypothetical protein